MIDNNAFPVRRHQAGRSSFTEISVERNSSRPPRGRGSMCCRMRSNRPLPQSRSPPSKHPSAACGWRANVSICVCAAVMTLVADAGRTVGEKLDQLCAADDAGSGDQIVLVQLALLEARRTYPDRTARLDEVVHQV